jgi:ribosomal protein S12 methylthiotransferase accessory factor YcaO
MDQVDDLSATVTSIESCAAVLLERLAALGLERVYRVALTSRDDDLQVVRVIVPGAELYSSDIPRVGVRLRDHAQAS